MGDPHLSLRALVLADERPYVPIERLLERDVDVVLCLGDLSRRDLEPLADARLPKLGVHGNHDRGDEFGGFSGSNEYHAEPRYTWSQKKASKLLRKFGHVDVMLAHSPPLGVNDDPEDAAHTGLVGLREYVERERPAMLLHGHTYPPLPVERWGDTEVRHVRGHRYVTLPQSVASAL
jgi:Icc-related predicted phosphoesterase